VVDCDFADRKRRDRRLAGERAGPERVLCMTGPLPPRRRVAAAAVFDRRRSWPGCRVGRIRRRGGRLAGPRRLPHVRTRRRLRAISSSSAHGQPGRLPLTFSTNALASYDTPAEIVSSHAGSTLVEPRERSRRAAASAARAEPRGVVGFEGLILGAYSPLWIAAMVPVSPGGVEQRHGCFGEVAAVGSRRPGWGRCRRRGLCA
jgi:hypothetical protein